MAKVRRLLILLILVGGGVAAYVYVNRSPSALVLTGIVTTQDLVVSPQIGGRLAKVLVNEGDTVTADQLLAVLSPEELQAESSFAVQNVAGLTSQVHQAEAALRLEQKQTDEQIRQTESMLASLQAQETASVAELEKARLGYERTRNLAQEGVAPAQDLDSARTAFEAARARVDSLRRQAEAQGATIALAKANAEQIAVRRSQVQANEHLQAAAAAQQTKADVRLAYTEIKAPIGGIVDVRAARVGEVVTSGQAIVTLINPDDLWIRADVEETYIDRIRIGDHMTVRLPSGVELEGKVFYRGADAAFATQRDVSRTKRDIKTFEIRLRCDNTDRRLAVGMTAYVLLPV